MDANLKLSLLGSASNMLLPNPDYYRSSGQVDLSDCHLSKYFICCKYYEPVYAFTSVVFFMLLIIFFAIWKNLLAMSLFICLSCLFRWSLLINWLCGFCGWPSFNEWLLSLFRWQPCYLEEQEIFNWCTFFFLKLSIARWSKRLWDHMTKDLTYISWCCFLFSSYSLLW